MKEFIKENRGTFTLLFCGLILIFVGLPYAIYQMKIKTSAELSILRNGLVFKGDTIIAKNISTIVFLPEDRDSLKLIFNRADKLTEYIYKNKEKISEYNKIIGTLHNGSLTVKYQYRMFNIVALYFVRTTDSRWLDGSIHIIYHDETDKFIYILTKYKKYWDIGDKQTKKEQLKTQKLKETLDNL